MSKEMLCEVYFDFSKKIPQFLKDQMIKEFMALRNIACNRLNDKYDAWNAEYDGPETTEDIWSEQNKSYNEFIVSKQRPILQQINKDVFTWTTEIDCDEVGDLIARSKFDPELTARLTIKLLDE